MFCGPFFLAVNLAIGALIYRDAARLKRRGIRITPLIWLISGFLFSFLVLFLYLLMRSIFWKVRLRQLEECSQEHSRVDKQGLDKIILFRALVLLLVFICCFAIFGCHIPLRAHLVHRRIKAGMSIEEIFSILSEYKGISAEHSYWITLIVPEAEEECARNKARYEKCLAASFFRDCDKRFPAYSANCAKKMYKPERFMQIAREVSNNKVAYARYEADVVVMFVGPGFLKNDFHVYFNRDGKVKSVSPVKHWD